MIKNDKSKIKILGNPYYIYCIIWLAVLLLYGLGWSRTAPNISLSMWLFIIFTGIVSLALGRSYAKRTKHSLQVYAIGVGKHNWRIVFCILLAYAIEFIYMREIPLFALLLESGQNYAAFGIPVLHVPINAFTCFYSVYLMHQFLSSKKLVVFAQYICSFIPHILVFSRGSIIMVLIASVFCFLQQNKSLNIKTIIVFVIIGVIGLYLFGLLGNIRSFSGNSNTILEISDADNNFIFSIIPKEFFWTYSYGALPFGTFQFNVDNIQPVMGLRGIWGFLSTSILPDFIAKRLPAPIPADFMLLFPYFNVGGANSAAFAYLGWWGPILLFIYMIVVIKVFKYFVKTNNIFYVTGMSMILTIIVFNFFDNLWVFSGFSLTIIFAIIGSFIFKPKKQILKVEKEL